MRNRIVSDRMKHTIFFALIAVSLLFLIAGCAQQAGNAGANTPAMNQTNASQPAANATANQSANASGSQANNSAPTPQLPEANTTGNASANISAPLPQQPASNTTNTTGNQTAGAPPDSNISCISQFAGTEHMDVFDSHVHIMTKVSASQAISEMDKAGVGMSLLYPIDGNDDSDSLLAISQYPGRFEAFVDTPDSPEPSTWLSQGSAFTAFAEAQLKTGKFCGIGETNLRYYSGYLIPPPDVYVAPDTPLWLSLVDLSAKYNVPISFHFVPDDTAANAAFEMMLRYNKNATVLWSHLGFNNMPLNQTALNDFLLQYPNMYFDTAGIQNMQNPLPQPNSNWALLANGSSNGSLNAGWKPFFETWNSRILFGSDAGGGSNGLERWLNYADDSVNGATPNAVGHWKSLLSNLDYNSARNILSGNARALLMKEQRLPYNYSVSSDGKCYPISISSNSSISYLAFDSGTKVISFTAADSTGAAGSAAITVPTALAGGNFTAFVDGQGVQVKEASNSTHTTISLEYGGGIKSITLRAPK